MQTFQQAIKAQHLQSVRWTRCIPGKGELEKQHILKYADSP